MFQIRIYATFILIAGVIAPVVALPMPSPPQAGSSKDGSHPIENPPSPNSPHSDFFFNIEGINTDGGHDVRNDQHHDTSSIYSDIKTKAPYTKFESSKPIEYEHANPFAIPRTPPRISPLSSQIREDESHKDISSPPSRSSSTSEQAAAPQSPLHHGQTLPPTGNTGSPPRIPFKDKGKKREHTISSNSDSDSGSDSDSYTGSKSPPAPKKRKVNPARSIPASSSSNRNRLNDMRVAAGTRAAKLKTAKSGSPTPGLYSSTPEPRGKKRKASFSDSDSGSDSGTPAPKKRKRNPARSIAASSSSNQNRRNDMRVAAGRRAAKLKASKSPTPGPSVSAAERARLKKNARRMAYYRETNPKLVVECPKCEKQVEYKGKEQGTLLSQHINKNHPEDELLSTLTDEKTCELCLKNFTTMSNKNSHKCKGKPPEDC